MIHYLILFVFVITSLYSEEVFTQKEIDTPEDYNQLEKVLKDSLLYEPSKGNYYLGLLYSQPHTFKDGSVRLANFTKAIEHFQYAYDNGRKIAAYNISLLLVQSGKIDEGLFLLQDTINQIRNNPNMDSIVSYLSVSMAALILTHKFKDKEALNLGINNLQPVLKKNSLPTGNYLLSQLYYKLNDQENANRYLNISCLDTSAPSEIKRICKKYKRGAYGKK